MDREHASSCHPSHIKGRVANQIRKGAHFGRLRTTATTNPAKTRYAQFIGHGNNRRNSNALVGVTTNFSKIGGLPNLSKATPRNIPNRIGKNSGSAACFCSCGVVPGAFIPELQSQFQQPHFNRQRFLHVGVQPTLELLQGMQILQGVLGRNSSCDFDGGLQFGKVEQFITPGLLLM